ncbi:MAG: penicillin-binding protein 2 [Algisphaera sp.]
MSTSSPTEQSKVSQRKAARRSRTVEPPSSPDTNALTRGRDRALRVGRITLSIVTLFLVLLLARVFQLQLQPPEAVGAMVDNQISLRRLEARRGAIVDRRHRALATTRVAHLLFADPHIVKDPNTFSERIGYPLGYEPAAIEQLMAKRRGSRYVVIDPHMSEERWEKYQNLDPLRGLSTHPVLVRDYPQNHVAGQLVGFVGRENKGLDGLERALDKRLTADPGQHAFVYNRSRKRLWLANKNYRLQADAPPVRLSIDLNLQAIAEEEVSAAVIEFGAKSGQAVLMDPTTGEILALANYPFFDPNDFSKLKKDKALAQAQRNRAATDIFEPGSIFKPLVWAAAVEAGYADPTEMIDCTEKGYWKPERGPGLRDAHPHGLITWADVLKVSSNIGMAVVAERMGKQLVHDVVKSYGFGSTTQSGLPGEVAGLLRPAAKWSFADVTRVPMGQGVAVTGVQITRAFCAIANDGILVNPTIEARDPQNKTAQRLNITARVLSPRVAQATRHVLGLVITEGTGRKARSDLYQLFGKTGTAQLPDFKNGGYHQDRYVSSFVAGAPLEHPKLIVGVFVHDPDKKIGHYGGTVSGPASKRILERSLQYLGVPSDIVSEEEEEEATDGSN